VRRLRVTFATLSVLCLGAAPSLPKGPAPTAALGLAVNLPSDASTPVQNRALREVRATGVNFFVLSLFWETAEPTPGRYRVGELTRTARLLRQSGALLHLDLPLVEDRFRKVPADLAAIAFDDPKLSLRLGRLLNALAPALLDFATVSLGSGADAYFAHKPSELAAYRRLFDGAIQFLGKNAPHLRVGVTTYAPNESPAAEVAAALHERSHVLFYVYAPFEKAGSFVHRPPDAIEEDWKKLFESGGDRPIAFPEVSYSSAGENGSSLARQADFVRRFRRLVAATDRRRLLFARYVPWRDPPQAATAPEGAPSPAEGAWRAFDGNRGLQTAAGRAKPAWHEWVRARSRITQ